MLFYFKNKKYKISEFNFESYNQQKVMNLKILTNEFFDELEANHIKDIDIHSGNVGIYNGKLVIIDLGAIQFLV